MHEFDVHEVKYLHEPDINTETLAIAGNPDSDQGCVGLMIQKSLEVDEQDRRLGQDTYCLVDDLQNTFYGGVVRWTIGDGYLVIALEEEAAREMEVEGGYLLRLLVDESSVAELSEYLRRLFETEPGDAAR